MMLVTPCWRNKSAPAAVPELATTSTPTAKANCTVAMPTAPVAPCTNTLSPALPVSATRTRHDQAVAARNTDTSAFFERQSISQRKRVGWCAAANSAEEPVRLRLK